MAYADYLNQLLAPLGVYALGEGSISGAMIAALGAELDAVWAQLQQNLEDAFPQSVSAAALPLWERLVPSAPAQTALAQRRAALTALASFGGVACGKAALNSLLTACGYAASLSMPNDELTIQGADAAQAVLFLTPFLPAHLLLHLA